MSQQSITGFRPGKLLYLLRKCLMSTTVYWNKILLFNPEIDLVEAICNSNPSASSLEFNISVSFTSSLYKNISVQLRKWILFYLGWTTQVSRKRLNQSPRVGCLLLKMPSPTPQGHRHLIIVGKIDHSSDSKCKPTKPRNLFQKILFRKSE